MKRVEHLTRVLAVGFGLAWGVNQVQASYLIGDAGLEAFQVTWDGKSESVLAGGISLSSGGGAADYVSVCTDIGGTIYLGYSYNYSQPQEFSGHSGLSPLWGANETSTDAQAAIQAAADIFYNHKEVLTTGTTTQKAALQLAVWEALYNTTATGNSLSISGGRFSVDPNSGDTEAITMAGDWVKAANLNASYVGYLLVPDGTQYGLTPQELFYNVTPAPDPPAPVPEPTTVIAGALLLLPFGVSTIRVLRRNRGR
jgi:hypothetical protein